MKVAFISGPYRANTPNGVFENIMRARAVALKYWKLGYAVICPHMNTMFMDGACEDEVWLLGDLEIIDRLNGSDCIVMMTGWEGSKGAVREYQRAETCGLEVIYESDTDQEATT